MVFFCFKKWKPRLIFKQCAICSIAKAITSCSFHRFVLLVCLRACVAGLAMNEIVSCVPVSDFICFHRYLWQYRNSVISPGLLPDNYYQVKDLYRLFPVRAVEGTWNIFAILQSFLMRLFCHHQWPLQNLNFSSVRYKPSALNTELWLLPMLSSVATGQHIRLI